MSYITADEARKLSDKNNGEQSVRMLKGILDEIKRAADAGSYSICSAWNNKTLLDVEIVERNLRELGYKVRVEMHDYSIAFGVEEATTFYFNVNWK